MKALYQELRAQIEAETTAAHVRLWNNQADLIGQGEQIPFLFPAVFIDFPEISWIQKGKGTQGTDLLIRCYCCFESFHTTENEEDLAVFDFREEVYLALQDFKPTLTGKLQRVAEQTDVKHDNVYVWVIDFSANFQDITAQFPRGGVIAQIDTIVLDKDLQIDPGTVDGIRTDKDFD